MKEKRRVTTSLSTSVCHTLAMQPPTYRKTVKIDRYGRFVVPKWMLKLIGEPQELELRLIVEKSSWLMTLVPLSKKA